MNLTPRQRPIVIGLALAGTAALTAGTTAVVVTRAPAAVHSQPQTAQAQPSQGPAPAASPATPAARATVKPRPAVVVPAAGTPRPITMSQAVSVATRRTHARFEKVEADYGPQGLVYDVNLVRPSGVDVEVLVLARTGQVISVDEDFD
ncbi:MAG TPA: PepSY domain-containing protein [Pedococcus sp.]|jgi:uncharacterized membrane protein YkoI|uniref:PepSY domain-containing protein n=1 Tax=Pedococcus sp. TaxID=2860345 RepID=UPI002F94518A